ncbi:MAG: GNAT family N-acetyltransferase [Acidimicrobiales bacterium]|jgi:ribosomal protein S18 acetylase RimI-like enzyme
MASSIRAAGRDDLPAILALWTEAEVEAGHTDNLDSLERLIAHDPGALLIAELGGSVVGSIIAAWDGWRGSVYRLAVAPSQRRGGLGRRLLAEAEARLAGLGAVRLQAIVVETDPLATAFWRSSGWPQQAERLRFTKG